MRDLLRPFGGAYGRYTAGMLLRQALLVLGGYSMVRVLRLCVKHATVPEWIFVAAFVMFDSSYMVFDQALNYFFSSRINCAK
jgi:hypothetical protein